MSGLFVLKSIVFVMCLLLLMDFLQFDSGPAMKFRNYVPQAKELQDGKVAPLELPKFEDPIAALPPAVEKKEVCEYFSFICKWTTKSSVCCVCFTCAS